MKTRLFILTILLCFTMHSWGQNSIKIIKLDFKEKRFTNLDSLEDLKQGDFYQLQIDNINLNHYKVSIGKTDSIVVSEVEFPTFNAIGLGSITDILSSLNNATFSAPLVTVEDPISLAKSKEVLKLKSDLNRINVNKSGYTSEEQAIINMKNESINKLQYEINLLEIDNLARLSFKDQILYETKLASDSLVEMAKTLKEHIRIINNSVIAQLELVALTYKESIYDKPTESTSIFETLQPKGIKTILEATKIEQMALFEIENKINTIERNYRNFIDKNKNSTKFMALFEKDEDIKNKHKQLLAAIEKLKIETMDSVYSKINTINIIKYLNAIIDLDNNKERSILTLPMQHNGDVSKLSINITPKKEEFGNHFHTEISFPKNNKFYVGVGTSFYYGNFKNEVYSIKANIINDTTTNYQIVDEKNKNGEIGIATLIHFGYRPFSKNRDWDIFAVNLVTGPALSLTNTVKARLAIGGGIALGRKNMLTINGLYMGGFVDQKSEVFDTAATYSERPDKITVSKLQGAFAISLGYIYKF